MTWWKSPLRTSRPNPIAAFDPKYTAPTANPIWNTVTASINPPMRQM